jgi:uncharacterized protein (TIGR02611 family)
VLAPPPPAQHLPAATSAHGRAARLVRRFLVAVAGACVVLLGLVLVPLPGPGWPIVFLGFVVLGSEFVWADRIRRFAQSHVARGVRWSTAAPWPARAVLSAAMIASLVIPMAVLAGRI